MTTTETSPFEPLVEPETRALATKVATEVASGKIALADVWASLNGHPTVPEVVGERKAPVVRAMTDTERAALQRLPEVYGKVTPTKDRALNATELHDIVEEREVLDVILALCKKRKDESIRETLANHLDHVYEVPEGAEPPPVDEKGHYQIKHEIPVPGTDKKVQKTVSEPKPFLSMAAVQKAHEDGLLDRKTYLAITKQPEVPRVLDEDGLVKAIKRDPSLLFRLAPLTETPKKTTTIKVAKNT